ncbi:MULTISPECIES: low temperature requirement protein A [unclassified Novosphingobium]|uniref:low temperature requirement protein A n=1 Tax=unclassified Novosphingobium TaxID=2644732 RepID=UPI00146A4CE2|nr:MULTISPECIES: low temperature requirement protein A [unclassified Novosphingobium]NMN05992.1 low temperature requirement protein LtrA [Novosphingobium sp. SG919]NMN88288.1 low temperature requirement protein LtrA [Novosphingobium sp. SG916]
MSEKARQEAEAIAEAGKPAPKAETDGVPAPSSLLRDHKGGHAPVSYLELFFDLVYVFAITQLSHNVLHHMTPAGLAEALVLFLAVWWAWMFTTWAANWTNPERGPVRIMLLFAMLASLGMAVAMPRAFAGGSTGDAVLFAACYIAVQIGRSGFVAWAMAKSGGTQGHSGGWRSSGARNMARITLWFVASAPLWLAGALVDAPMARLGWWAAALAVDYGGPFMGFFVPGLGRSTPEDWDISGSHLAERCALFIIIALGEGIVVTGTSFAQETADPARSLAFVLAFIGSALMWWIYFDLGAERGARHIAEHAQPGRLARSVYTYLHMPIVGGIVITAVADALLLEQPLAPASLPLVATQAGGLLVFLAGTGLFKRPSSPHGNFPLSHWVGGGVLIALAGLALLIRLPSPAFVGSTVLALLLVAVWEWISYHRRGPAALEAQG